MIREFKLYATSDSVFLDSPLNYEGIDQALELRKFIETSSGHSNEVEELINVMAGTIVYLL